MSLNGNTAAALVATIIIGVTCSISICAQTTGVATSTTANSASIRETPETSLEKKHVRPTEGTDLTASLEKEPKIRAPSIVSDSVQVDAGTTVTDEVAGGPAVRIATTSPQTTSTDEWQFQFTPYFWLASLHGTGGVGNRTAEVDMSFGDILDSLKFALMGVFEARKGKLVLVTDMEYVSIEDEGATPGPLFSDVTAKFKVFIFDPEVGYRIYDDPTKGAYVDVLGGIRVWHVSTELDFGAGILPATQVDGSRNWVDAIIGLRGKMALSEKVFVTGKFDLGGGGSKFTYQVFGGGGYNINSKVALILGYRVLDVNYNKNNFIYDMNQRGPIMGVGFKF